MDDPSSSDDDQEGWDDEFTTGHVVAQEELLPREEGERGLELGELGAEDDWIDGELAVGEGDRNGEKAQLQLLTAPCEEVLVCRAKRVVQRNGVWKIDFTAAILHLSGRDVIYSEISGNAKF